MKTVQVKLFGPQAQLAGRRELCIALESTDVTCDQLMGLIASSEPALALSMKSSRLAVNHEFVDGSSSVRPQDEVALIGMVSGG